MLSLYFSPMACSLAARIALNEAKLDARFVAVDLASKRLPGTGDDFLAISAMGQVPILVTGGGDKLTENAAVLQYIADLAPQAGLAPPSGSALRYRLQQWLSFVGNELHKSGLYPLFSPATNDGAKSFARQRLEHALPHVCKHLAANSFLVGETFTVADAYLTWALLLIRFGGVELDPVLAAYLSRMLERPALRAAVTEERRMVPRSADSNDQLKKEN